MVDERKLLCSLYAAAWGATRASSEPKYARLAQHSMRAFDEPFKTFVEYFKEAAPSLATLVVAMLPNVTLACGGAARHAALKKHFHTTKILYTVFPYFF